MCPSLENLPEGILTLNGVVIIIESPGFKGFVRRSSEMSICSFKNCHFTISPFTLKSRESI
ncbi:MAG: Uncharacterised protein [Crocinitomicaceae bacterium]|nr:MAG: Uncharacterised protein [Crocinitomicaceae bacterium]